MDRILERQVLRACQPPLRGCAAKSAGAKPAGRCRARRSSPLCAQSCAADALHVLTAFASRPAGPAAARFSHLEELEVTDGDASCLAIRASSHLCQAIPRLQTFRVHHPRHSAVWAFFGEDQIAGFAFHHCIVLAVQGGWSCNQFDITYRIVLGIRVLQARNLVLHPLHVLGDLQDSVALPHASGRGCSRGRQAGEHPPDLLLTAGLL
mmetsp:Transcript_111218/g.346670  ORF Transcript_111218/g.346670 Transcript_111218/m.346670 type:complete len:208 (+) Transcript_111218:39-662(+)